MSCVPGYFAVPAVFHGNARFSRSAAPIAPLTRRFAGWTLRGDAKAGE